MTPPLPSSYDGIFFEHNDDFPPLFEPKSLYKKQKGQVLERSIQNMQYSSRKHSFLLQKLTSKPKKALFKLNKGREPFQATVFFTLREATGLRSDPSLYWVWARLAFDQSKTKV